VGTHQTLAGTHQTLASAIAVVVRKEGNASRRRAARGSRWWGLQDRGACVCAVYRDRGAWDGCVECARRGGHGPVHRTHLPKLDEEGTKRREHLAEGARALDVVLLQLPRGRINQGGDQELGPRRPDLPGRAPARTSSQVRSPSPTLSPTDPVPRGLLTLCPGASSGPQGLYTA